MAHTARGAIKDYDWGIVNGLMTWSGLSTGQPQAELWFGVHPAGPSPLLDMDGSPTGRYLSDVADISGIPILVKLLAVARPLSVQVHPNSEYVSRIWESEEARTGATVLSDTYEKTEMLVALEPFEAFVGWRERSAAIALLEHLPHSELAITCLASGDVRSAIRALLAIEDVAGAVAAIPSAATASGASMSECHAFSMVADLYPEDAGALLTPLLGYVTLEPGEAVYVPAGMPHSYIRGIGLEVMTSSDNVLRLGLTTKPVFVEESLLALDLTGGPTVVRVPIGEAIQPAGAAFQVVLSREGARYLGSGSYRFVLLIEGQAKVVVDGAQIDMQVGSAVVLGAQESEAEVISTGLVAIVEARGGIQ